MLERIKKNIINIPGKKTAKKLLVFESDDWGSIRIPDNETRGVLLKKGYLSDKDPFSKFDSLETQTDLEQLFNALSQIKDSENNPPVITANTIVANPDFNKIKAGAFQKYYFEPFTKTYANYADSENAFEVFKKGMEAGFFHPQFHGREHLNVPMWMQLLQNNNEAFMTAFNLNCFAIDFKDASNKRGNLMAAFDYNSEQDFSFIKESISEGLEQFENIFGFKSKSFIAPCYVWDKNIETIFAEEGVKSIQGSRFQNIPSPQELNYQKKFHYTGQKNRLGQMYFQRNGLFEPSLNPTIDWVDKCMESIAIAFKWHKPAIIGTHRINFCGRLDSKNRDNNLILLKELLRKILKQWPDVSFISSDRLYTHYNESKL